MKTSIWASLLLLSLVSNLIFAQNNDFYTLLPTPQQINYTKGTYTQDGQKYIYIQGPVDDALLSIARTFQQAAESIGRKFELTAYKGSYESIAIALTVDPNSTITPQGYQLRIGEKIIEAKSSDKAGLYYAAQTFKQMCRQSKKGLLCSEVNDFPSLPNRGVMLDVSRDKVPTMQTLKEMIDMFSEFKYNQLQLYMEHTFAYRGHEKIWQNASPFTGEEILELDDYCRKHFINLVPNQNSFAHLGRWLGNEPYRQLAEDFNYPEVLNPADANSIKFLDDLYSQLLPHFSSSYINVGCDETVLGKGKTKELCKQIGPDRVYLDFLLKIHKLVQQKGRTMMFWADIIFIHPNLIPELPKDCIALVWGYASTSPYEQQTKILKDANVPFYVCPGTNAWESLIGRTENMIGNVRITADTAVKNKGIGLLITDWGDMGHWWYLPISYAGFSYAAAMAWSPQANRDIDLANAMNIHVFFDKAGIMGKLALDLGRAYRKGDADWPQVMLPVYFMYAPNAPLHKGWFESAKIEPLSESVDKVENLLPLLDKTEMQRADAQLIKDEFRNDAKLFNLACNIGIVRLQSDANTLGDVPYQKRQKLAEELKLIIAEHKRLWLQRNRIGGLDESAGGMQAVLDICQKTAK